MKSPIKVKFLDFQHIKESNKTYIESLLNREFES